MHEYLMEVQHYFLGKQRFQVNADNKIAAVEKGIEYANRVFGRDNYISGTVKAIRKLKPSFGRNKNGW